MLWLLIGRASGFGGRLEGGAARIVPAAGADLQALVFRDFGSNFVVFAVGDVVWGIVGQRVLGAQLIADVLERLIQGIHMGREEGAAAGLFRKGPQNLGAFGEM